MISFSLQSLLTFGIARPPYTKDKTEDDLYVKFGDILICSRHSPQVAKQYCEFCSEVVCAECSVLSKHESHPDKIFLLKNSLPKIVAEFEQEIIPLIRTKIEQYSSLSEELIDWKETLEHRHHASTENLEKERTLRILELEESYKAQLVLLETAYANTKSEIAKKQKKIDARIKESIDIKNSIVYAIEKDEYELPLRKTYFQTIINQIPKPQRADILTYTTKDPLQYPNLALREFEKNINYFTKFELMNTKNPFKEFEICANSINLYFEFEQSCFRGLGFQYSLPEVVVDYKYDCTICDKAIMFILTEKNVSGTELSFKFKINCSCGIKWKWEKLKGEFRVIDFKVSGRAYNIVVPYALQAITT